MVAARKVGLTESVPLGLMCLKAFKNEVDGLSPGHRNPFFPPPERLFHGCYAAESCQMMLTVSDVGGRSHLCEDGMPLPEGTKYLAVCKAGVISIE